MMNKNTLRHELIAINEFYVKQVNKNKEEGIKYFYDSNSIDEENELLKSIENVMITCISQLVGIRLAYDPDITLAKKVLKDIVNHNIDAILKHYSDLFKDELKSN